MMSRGIEEESLGRGYTGFSKLLNIYQAKDLFVFRAFQYLYSSYTFTVTVFRGFCIRRYVFCKVTFCKAS